MNLPALLMPAVDFLKRKVSPPKDNFFERWHAESTGLPMWDLEQHRTYLLARGAQHKVPQRSKYRKVVDRFIKDEGISLSEYLQLKNYLAKIEHG